MLYREIKKPKPSQTIFTIDGTGKDAKLRKLFITKVITTASTETPIALVVGTSGFNEEGQFIQTQGFRREFKNHILVETRCGEFLDLSTNERTSQSSKDSTLGQIFLSKKQANKEFRKQKSFVFIADEYGAFRYNSSIPKA